MKILFLNTQDIAGGAAIATHRIYKQVAKKNGLSCTFICSNKQTNDKNINLLSFKNTKKNDDGNNKYKYKVNFIFSPAFNNPLSNLITQIKEINPDIIHLNWIAGNFMDIEDISKIAELNIPVVWTMHDMWSFTGGCHVSWDLNDKYKFCFKYYEECSNCPYIEGEEEKDISYKSFKKKEKAYQAINIFSCIAVSNWMQEEARKSKLLQNTDIRIIHNGIDLFIFKPYDKKKSRDIFNLPQNKKLIIFGAAYTAKIKGYHILQEALNKLKYSDDELEFVVYGNEIETGKFNYKVNNIGRISEQEDVKLAKLFSACDVKITPSIFESFGLTTLEGLACGTPVVSFNNGGPKDIVDHKINGYLAEPYRPEDLAKGIEWVINHPKYDGLCKAARKKAQQFDINKISKQYIDLYKDLIAKNNKLGIQKTFSPLKKEGGLRLRNKAKISSKKKPLVSIVSVIHNLYENKREESFLQMVDSVMTQDYGRANIEHIIMDGGSTDGTVTLLNELDALGKIDYWKSEKDTGIYQAMNRGIKTATGTFINCLNSDDFFTEDAVSTSINAILKNNADLSHADMFVKDKDGNLSDFNVERDLSRAIFYCPIPQPTVFMKKSIFNEIGYFDENFKIAGDHDFFFRLFLSKKYKTVNVNKKIVTYSTDGISSNSDYEKKIKSEIQKIFIKNGSKVKLSHDDHIFLISELLNPELAKIVKDIKLDKAKKIFKQLDEIQDIDLYKEIVNNLLYLLTKNLLHSKKTNANLQKYTHMHNSLVNLTINQNNEITELNRFMERIIE